jgi:hypothetical protein
LDIRAALADADPNNAEVQRDVSISHEKIGNLLDRSGNPAGALAQYRQCLVIDTRMAENDPGSAQEQSDCAETHENISRMLIKLGDLTGALVSENLARELREGVAAKDEKNVVVRGDLAANYQELGEISDMLAKKDANSEYARDGCSWYERELDVMHDLQQRGALDKDAEEVKKASMEVSKCETAMKAMGPAPQTAHFSADNKK